MGDNKISEAAVEAACAVIYHGYVTGKKDYRHECEKEARAALEAALPHLQGEGVPVAQAEAFTVSYYSPMNFGGFMVQFQSPAPIQPGTKVYLHPQPAELSEVSGNSGELGDVNMAFGTWINHEREPHCCGCFVIHWNAGEPIAVCNECNHTVNLLAALAATGKQQVGEVQVDRTQLVALIVRNCCESEPSDPDHADTVCINVNDLEAIVSAQLEAVVMEDDPIPALAARQRVVPTPQQISDYLHGLDEIKRAVIEREALAACQPGAQEAVAVVGSDFTLLWAGSGPIAPMVERHGLKRGSLLYAAPPAQGIDLGQFRDSVIHECLRAHAEWQGDLMTYDEYLAAEQKRDRLLALIDGRDAGTGVGNIQPPRDLRTQVRPENKDSNNG
jgi:hypothetical protein